MWELTEEEQEERVRLYLERIEMFLTQVRGWCEARQLVIKAFSFVGSEEGLPDYTVPYFLISLPNGRKLCELKPTGALTLTGQGRIDLKGRIDRHIFIYHVDDRPIVDGRRWLADESIHGRLARGVNGSGWYWLENRALRQKFVDETLFFDILSDAANHEIV
jgi:hypothetical protein